MCRLWMCCSAKASRRPSGAQLPSLQSVPQSPPEAGNLTRPHAFWSPCVSPCTCLCLQHQSGLKLEALQQNQPAEVKS